MSIKKIIAAAVTTLMMITSLPVSSMAATKGWQGNDRNGWRYYTDSISYVKSNWKQINGKWYYFNSDGLMESNCYRNGCWLTSSGAWNPSHSNGKWMKDSKGWWYSDNGWYPKSEWLWIDGKCYYFDAQGYMESDCYRDGYWLDSSGARDLKYIHGIWKKDSIGWRYEDTDWKPISQNLIIDGTTYWFDDNGYWNANYKSSTKSSSGGSYSTDYDERTVYVSRTGIYHYNSSCSRMKYYTPMSLSQAQANGHRGCKKCT